MRISELAHATGVSIRSLRHYEQKRLLRPRRLENGYRDYEEGAINQVRAIRFYLGMGLNTDEIGKLINCKGEPVWAGDHAACTAGLLSLYTQKMQVIDDEIRSLAQVKTRLAGCIHWLQEGSTEQTLLQKLQANPQK